MIILENSAYFHVIALLFLHLFFSGGGKDVFRKKWKMVLSHGFCKCAEPVAGICEDFGEGMKFSLSDELL